MVACSLAGSLAGWRGWQAGYLGGFCDLGIWLGIYVIIWLAGKLSGWLFDCELRAIWLYWLVGYLAGWLAFWLLISCHTPAAVFSALWFHVWLQMLSPNVPSQALWLEPKQRTRIKCTVKHSHANLQKHATK